MTPSGNLAFNFLQHFQLFNFLYRQNVSSTMQVLSGRKLAKILCGVGLYLCRWALQGVVVQDDALQLSQPSVAHRDEAHLVTGEV